MADKEALNEKEMETVAGGELMAADQRGEGELLTATIVCQSCGSTMEISRRHSPTWYHCRKCGGKMWWAKNQNFEKGGTGRPNMRSTTGDRRAVKKLFLTGSVGTVYLS